MQLPQKFPQKSRPSKIICHNRALEVDAIIVLKVWVTVDLSVKSDAVHPKWALVQIIKLVLCMTKLVCPTNLWL